MATLCRCRRNGR
jgi:hypothetical protein